jgi:hypothetical protein
MRTRPKIDLKPAKLLLIHHLADIRLLKAIGALAFAGHSRTAIAAVVALPHLVRVVFAHPAEAAANGTIGVDHGMPIARPYFSRRTPLNFFAAFFFVAGFFTAMNSPLFLLRLVHAVAPPSFVLS